MLSASCGVGATRYPMMVDRSLGKAQERSFVIEAVSGGDRETGALDFLVRPAHRLALGLRVAQRGVAGARELVGKRADGFVVIGARLHGESPVAQRIDVFPDLHGATGRIQHRAGAVGEEPAQVASAPFGEGCEMA